MTLIAVSIPVRNLECPEGLIEQARRAQSQGAGLVEWRIDTLTDPQAGLEALSSLLAESPIPSIITCRSAAEGGDWQGSDQERGTLLKTLCEQAVPPRYIDIELASWTNSHELRECLTHEIDHDATSLILSIHDFDGRPHDLSRRIAKAASEPLCAVIKVAYHARTLRDNLEIFEILRERAKPMIALGMGLFGQMSRILAGKFGAFATFASCEEGDETAPGQIPVYELTSRYRFHEISAQTKVMGIVGWPAFHSKGPVIHNAVFASEGLDAVFLAMPIAPEWASFKATIAEMLEAPDLQLAGLSVTTPHKPHALRLVEESGGCMTPLAQRVGVANTVAIGRDGDLEASNTDCLGAVQGLIDGMGIHRQDLKSKKVALLGAGGAARAVAVGLLDSGALITVFNRDEANAQEMCRQLNAVKQDGGEGVIESGALKDLVEGAFDILVNCTTVGMTGGAAPEESPLTAMGVSSDVITTDLTVYDIIYSPLETKLMEDAKARGAQVIGGLGMFLGQAVGQYEAWVGASASKDAYKRAWQQSSL
ncbi:MAG: type I 3-dehydroquinate dehydratase [Phycisphaerales bacterium]|nr:type I 3-dehydroquinate dehydratase [Phycisphaerales bacterium]